jgi:serine/threonine protein kinase
LFSHIFLGRGAFASVYLGLLQHKQVAVKKVRFSEDVVKYEQEVDEYFKEATIMIELRHENVVTLLGKTREERGEREERVRE